MYKISRLVIAITIIILAGFPLIAYAVSYPILEHPPQQVKGEVLMEVGTIVYLFHSGASDIKKSIGIGDVITVFRESPCCSIFPSGKVKVLSYVGKNYIRAEVTEGEIRPGDLAKKGEVAGIVIVFACDCNGAE
jgi:hypothetical protein